MKVENIDQIYAPEIGLENLGRLNQFVHWELLNSNSVGKPFEIKEFHYLRESLVKTDPWTYKINSQGFRGPEWKFKKGFIPFFGCSYTFGIGVEKNITTLFEEKTGRKCINLGIPGGCIPFVLKSFHVLNTLQPSRYAVITLPALDRMVNPIRNTHGDWEYHNMLPNVEEQKKSYEKVYRVLTSDYFVATALDYIAWAKTTAKLTGTRLYWSSWHDSTMTLIDSCINQENIFYYNYGANQVDLGRDNGHWGPKSTESWADNLIKFLKERNEL
jgi:Domain of unknown function (DUF6473)